MPRKYKKSPVAMIRFIYAMALILVIVIGLQSRKMSGIPVETGDALWSVALFCFIRLLCPLCRLSWVAWVSLLVSYAVEFSQLIRWDWLVEIRSTTLGHLLLGQGFQWMDLLAYTLGVALAWLIARWGEESEK